MINPMDLTGKTILITGASSGIGRETSVLLSQLGARLILVARNPERLQQTAERLEGINHQIEPFDLTNIDDIPHWLRNVATKAGPINGLVHCAGIHSAMPLRVQKSTDVRQVMLINYEAAVSLLTGFRHRKVAAPDSSIVLLSSVMGLVGQPGISAYGASKGAIIALTKSASLELARESIRVNCIAPAFVQTEMAQELRDTVTVEQFKAIEQMHPLGIGTALDVAYAIAFLLADTARWITGSTFVVDGGYTAH